MFRGYVYSIPRSFLRAGGLYISSVDFGCFSTFNGDCEALKMREEQRNFTLFCMQMLLIKTNHDYYKNAIERKNIKDNSTNK